MNLIFQFLITGALLASFAATPGVAGTCRSDAKGAVTSGDNREDRSTDAEHRDGAAASERCRGGAAHIAAHIAAELSENGTYSC